jgi:electron transfer flavoprotein alpha subunit
VALDAALATDCFGFEVRDGKILALRQMYSYKVNATVSFKDAEKIVATLRGGAFSFTPSGSAAGAVETVPSPLADEPLRKRFVGYVEAEKGDIDIASADIIISIGRGIGDEPDMEVFESLAEAMGRVGLLKADCGHLLPKYHQVGPGVEVSHFICPRISASSAGRIKDRPHRM